ncbi:MAG: hypothetical protein ACI83O_000584 [Patescibacteria group bacterium]|jgi:hypothetical protein
MSTDNTLLVKELHEIRNYLTEQFPGYPKGYTEETSRLVSMHTSLQEQAGWIKIPQQADQFHVWNIDLQTHTHYDLTFNQYCPIFPDIMIFKDDFQSIERSKKLTEQQRTKPISTYQNIDLLQLYNSFVQSLR